MRFLLLSVCLAGMCVAGIFENANSETERIEIFSDEALTNKNLVDNQPRTVDLYVAHFDTPATTGCALLRVVASPGFTGVWLSETSSWFTVGTTQAGLSFSYGYCLVGSAVIVKMTYQLFGTSAACSSLRTTAYPGTHLDGPLCDRCFSEYMLPGSSLGVNCPVATEATTWGSVKALYR